MTSHFMSDPVLGRSISCWLLVLCIVPKSFGQGFAERFDDWPLQTTINGRVLMGESLTQVATVLRDLVLEDDTAVALLHFGLDSDAQLRALQEFAPAATRMELEEVLSKQTSSLPSVIFLSATEAGLERLAAKVESVGETLTQVIAAGGTVAVSGNLAEMAGSYTAAFHQTSGYTSGLGLLPDCIIMRAYKIAQDASGPSSGSNYGDQDRLRQAVDSIPRSVGIGLSSRTVVLLSGRKVLCFGGEGIEVLVPEQDTVASQVVVQRASRGTKITNWLLDLTQWRRRAIEATLESFPGESPEQPSVPNGTLMIVGGGGMPPGLMLRFVELAGGPDNAKLVYVPCAEEDAVSSKQSTISQWQAMGVQSTALLHTKDRRKANEDPEFYSVLDEATGIWFGGGRQWNFSDSYYGTKTHQRMKDVLRRGGVIGGSSAGASIQARYLARATPIENFDIMAPGYERGGLGFLAGVAIDQHFTQRNRHPDMEQLVVKYPQLLGIGIDEATALIVQGTTATVDGKGSVYFFDRSNRESTTKIRVESGGRYDLQHRLAVESKTP